MSSTIKPISNSKISSDLNKLYKKLATGKRIIGGSDDPAGISIAKQLESDIGVSQQARRNLGSGTSLLSIGDDAIQQISDIGVRMSELAMQSANGTLNDEQRKALNNEYQQLKLETKRIVETTEFNGINVFKDGKVTIQSGKDGSSSSQLVLGETGLANLVNNLNEFDISTEGNSKKSLVANDKFLTGLSESRGSIGAVLNRIDFATSNLNSSEIELENSRSRIEDFDIAAGIAEKTALEIRQKISNSLATQTNRLRSEVALALLT
jgi:flagellin